jgi:hypothetical protein
MIKNILLVILLTFIAASLYAFAKVTSSDRIDSFETVPDGPSHVVADIVDFESCKAAGNSVMESYPRQCSTQDGKHFVENIGNELEKRDLIKIDSPRPGVAISSPLEITGEARGYWFFEASFPIALTDWDGRIIAQHYIMTADEWMTEDFVSFSGVLEYDSPYKAGDPDFMRRGFLILQKDNPSGLPEHDDALEIPVIFEQK